MKKQAEFTFLKNDGTVIHASLEATPIMSEDGEFLGVIAGVTDITDRKYAQKALHESNQKLRLLTSLTRHDILNQIFVIQILHDEVLNTTDLEKTHRYLSLIREAVNQIEATIGFTRDYDDFGVVSSGWLRIRPIIESAKSEISLQKVIIDNQIPETLEVYADPIIRKVFTTLMDNAIRHGKDLTIIVFSSVESGGSLLLICEDDGSGIPKEKKERIFEHGYGDHTGIGLFITREILTITDLSIHECGEEGKGARFEILVPNGKYRGLS
jgi:signal transduction histidine kinase